MPDPSQLEDFFACTIVVPTVIEIGNAEGLVLKWYDRKERRPADDRFTRKASSSFLFDDLRLYVARRPRTDGKSQDLDGILFEIQIKTILQHAWSVATHDLIYKTDSISWALERIAYQVKAMLEHAETSVAEASQLARSSVVDKADHRTRNILSVVAHLRKVWPEDQLPRDIRRLATNILAVLRGCGISVETLPEIVEDEVKRVGSMPKDMSPYAFTVQALAQSPSVGFQAALENAGRGTAVVIHDGMDVPDWMRNGNQRILDLGGATAVV